jgi:hypothetical protein
MRFPSYVQGVTTAVALQFGLGSPLFAISLAFSVIVMYDAMGVRQHAGKQAEVLNQVCTCIMRTHWFMIAVKEITPIVPSCMHMGSLYIAHLRPPLGKQYFWCTCGTPLLSIPHCQHATKTRCVN